MKKIMLSLGIALSFNSFAGSLPDYDAVKAAIMDMKTIRITTNFSKCTLENGAKTETKFALGLFTPNEIVITPDGSIKTSLKHFTLNDPKAPGKPVYEYVVYSILANNTVNLSVSVLDAVNYTNLAPKVTYSCALADSVTISTK